MDMDKKKMITQKRYAWWFSLSIIREFIVEDQIKYVSWEWHQFNLKNKYFNITNYLTNTIKKISIEIE